MQRLFSMFPTGLPGIGLLCLRLAAIGPVYLMFESMPSRSAVLMWGSATLAFSLGVGVATPVVASLCCIAELRLLMQTDGMAFVCAGVSALVSFALTLLGPGAYSIDARLFGRRSVVFKTIDERDDAA